MNITTHGQARVRKRIGIKKKAVGQMKQTAFAFGLKHSEATGNLKKYYDALYFKNRSASNIRIYSNFVWIFTKDVLITVFPVPQKFVKVVNKLFSRR